MVTSDKIAICIMWSFILSGHEIVCLANLVPPSGTQEMDSYMYQTVGSDAIEVRLTKFLQLSGLGFIDQTDIIRVLGYSILQSVYLYQFYYYCSYTVQHVTCPSTGKQSRDNH